MNIEPWMVGLIAVLLAWGVLSIFLVVLANTRDKRAHKPVSENFRRQEDEWNCSGK